MPGFLGGSGSGGGSGGVTEFIPTPEFIDPVTKFRVSQPETLIDTDFEYGLQPTKWETVELINNVASFFSKSGDTTIPNIENITTTAGSREIIVTTSLEHGLSVGTPINVKATKSLTADGSYIIGSIPNPLQFTYQAKVNQPVTQSINDLYTSIITGEFFQGSQIRISDTGGMEVATAEGESFSTITVKTDSPHGFGINTPFYFLNLNSTISQEFDSSNTVAKSFDSSNSATAQTFDGSNTLSQLTYNFSNSATRSGGSASTITGQSTANNTITVTHGSENFASLTLGAPLYYNVVTPTGYFATNPRGVVFLKDTSTLGTSSSTFTVSEVPDGDTILIEGSISGTFQIANEAVRFAGNNLNPVTEISLAVIEDEAKTFDGANSTGDSGTVTSYSGSLINISADSGQPNLTWQVNTMVLYTTTGAAAAGLTNNTTYWIDTIFQQGTTSNYSFTVKPTPTGTGISSISGGSGTQQFKKIGVSVDKDWIYLESHGYRVGDMLRYDYPVGGRFTATGGDAGTANFYYVEDVPNPNNFQVSRLKGGNTLLDGSTSALAAPSAIALKQTSDTYFLNLPNGIYWINFRGTPIQVYCDLTGAEAGSSIGGWIRYNNAFINTARGSISGFESINDHTYSAGTGTYIGGTTDNRLRAVRWLVPNYGVRGIRITQMQTNVRGADTVNDYTVLANLFSASNGTSIAPGAGFSSAQWHVLNSTGTTAQILTGATFRAATREPNGIKNLTSAQFTQFDNVGFDIDRILFTHSDGASETMDLNSYTIWIR